MQFRFLGQHMLCLAAAVIIVSIKVRSHVNDANLYILMLSNSLIWENLDQSMICNKANHMLDPTGTHIHLNYLEHHRRAYIFVKTRSPKRTFWVSKNLNYCKKECLGQIWGKISIIVTNVERRYIQNNIRIVINHRLLGWYCYLRNCIAIDCISYLQCSMFR